MTPVNYICIPFEILNHKDLSCSEKIVMGLVSSFNSKGTMLSNDEIGLLVGVTGDHITKILKKLKKTGLIEISNPQSRYRRIFYSGQNNGVDMPKPDSTPAFRTATPASTPVYSGQNNGHNIRNINKERKATQITFDAVAGKFVGITQVDMERWTTAYPGINLQDEIAKAADWLIRKNETRSDYRRFLSNWFGRSKPTVAPPPATINDIQGDSDEILKKAGFSPEHIEQLKQEGYSAS